MKKIKVIGVALLLTWMQTASAQSGENMAPPAPPHGPGHKIERMAQELSLTPGQTERLHEIFKRHKRARHEDRLKRRDADDDHAPQCPTPEQAAAHRKEMREEIRGVLSPEQYTRFLEFNFDNPHGPGRGFGHGPGGPHSFGYQFFHESPDGMVDRLDRELELSGEQIEKLHRELREKLKDLDRSMGPEERKAMRQSIKESLREVLTPEQMQRFKELKREKFHKHEKNEGKTYGERKGSSIEKGGLDVRAFPNPTRGRVRLEVRGASGDAGLRVLDANGRLIEKRTVNLNDPEILLDLTGYPAGVYGVEVSTANETRALKISVE